MTVAYIIAFIVVDFMFAVLTDWTIKDKLIGEFIVILLAAAPIAIVAKTLCDAGFDNFCVMLWHELPAWFRVLISILFLAVSILFLATVVSSTTVTIDFN